MCAIAGVCRDARGDTWAMVTLASQPDGFVETRIVDRAWISSERLVVDAGPLQADERSLRVDIGPGLHASFDAARGWTRPLGPLGVAQLVPWLGQYWSPHLLCARVTGGYGSRSLDGAQVYAEKNWGAAFAPHWWWGQAPGLAFAGGRIHGVAPTAVAFWSNQTLVALSPPLARTVARVGGGEWALRARSARWRVEIEGEAHGGLHLPVPLPATRELEFRSNHDLLGRIEYRVWRGRRLWRREAGVAALEDGGLAATGGAEPRRAGGRATAPRP